MDSKKEIIRYLQGPRDYREGVSLYNRYGFNLRLKRTFSLNETEINKSIMIEELRKLSGLTDREFRNLPRKALAKTENTVAKEETPKVETKQVPVTETQKKMIRFRDNYPFLQEPTCPDILKILVADMFTAYGNYKRALEKLEILGDKETEDAARLCELAVEEYLKNREIWEELDHYKNTGTLLGKAAKFREIEKSEEYSKLSDVDLMKKMNSAMANVSKRRKALDAAIASGNQDAIDKEKKAYDTWIERKENITAELDKRKKK